ncbi:MAG: prolyl oligopeptidase family serine peptidase [Bacteroidales bacterium]
MFTRRLVWTATLAASLLLAGLAQAQTEPKYLTPPKVVVDILDANPIPSTIVSPSRQQVAIVERKSMPTIGDLAQPMLRLAGMRINPKTNGPQIVSGRVYAITLKKIADGTEVKVTAPPDAALGYVSFSPDGRYLAFTNTTAAGISLWIADTRTGAAKAITTPTLNLVAGGCSWLDNSRSMLCPFVPAGRGLPPAAPKVPTGPNIQETSGKAAPAPTYEDLLKTAHDDALFEYYFTAQLAFVNVTTGIKSPVAKPGVLNAQVSPNGEFLLVSRVKRPFSHLVTVSEFPMDLEVWSKTGELVKKIADIPSGEGVPINGVRVGPRAYRWHPLEPATLVWVEALDGGDLRTKVEFRDRWVSVKAPFTATPTEIIKTANRSQSIQWTEKGLALVTEVSRGAQRMRTTWLLDGATAPRKLWELNAADRYKDPGTPMVKMTGVGALRTIQQIGDTIFLQSQGAGPQGDHPFLARFDLKSGSVEKLWECQGENYESVSAMLSDDGKMLLTRYETPKDPPNLYVRDLAKNGKRQLTQFKDPAPQLAGVQKQFVTYKRKDGVDLSGTLYLPPGYQKGQKVPLIMWAYPREFTDTATAAQVTGSPYRFTTVGGISHMFLLTQGYAIFDDPAMPIIGAGETANDTYVEQLVASAEAAVDKVVELGVTDRDHIGVGGHSYGAFMTANLLAHSRLFRAGVARSGAYNRTLTPFGFQSETRTFWEIPDVYMKMSPFRYASEIKDPILLIHGEADNNSGTFPIQSERMYMALKGHGATVRYVTLPLESHGYSARESVFHTLAEMINWFDKYVKNAGPRGTN